MAYTYSAGDMIKHIMKQYGFIGLLYSACVVIKLGINYAILILMLFEHGSSNIE